MMELVQRVNWSEYLYILEQGSPPIGLQLLVLNFVLLFYLLYRRFRNTKRRPSGGWVVPVLFIAGNLGVVTWGSRLQF